jgi:protein LSM14
METVERALGDLRVSSGVGRGGGGRRGHGRHGEVKEIKVPTTDFDFQGSNAKFDKSAIVPRKSPKDADEEIGPSDEAKEEEKKAYNPQSSFFDSLSSSTQSAPPARGGDGGRGGGGRGGGGPGGRNRREEERERNVATFGEPGGVGLMGPGAYVGGWGGYGRRGTRPRRGGPPVTNGR